MKVGYACISTSSGLEELDIHLNAIKKDGVKANDIFCDNQSDISGKKPQLTLCLKALTEGDTLVLYSLDSIGKSLLVLLKIINEIRDKKVALRILGSVDASAKKDPAMEKMMYQLGAMFSEGQRKAISNTEIDGYFDSEVS